MPAWVKVAIDAWTGPVGVVDGYVFRPVIRGDRVRGDVLSEKVVWQMLRPYAKAAGVAGIAPHDCRRTAAKLCRAAGGELEQIQLLLGHASVQTTERYLGHPRAARPLCDSLRQRHPDHPQLLALASRIACHNSGAGRSKNPSIHWLLPPAL
jgi:integrase